MIKAIARRLLQDEIADANLQSWVTGYEHGEANGRRDGVAASELSIWNKGYDAGLHDAEAQRSVTREELEQAKAEGYAFGHEEGYAKGSYDGAVGFGRIAGRALVKLYGVIKGAQIAQALSDEINREIDANHDA